MENQVLLHPYTVGALIAALTFLLAFRANFAYNRYWEAFTSVYQMHSKWLDVGTDLAAFHLQAAKYDKRKPPSFGRHPDVKFIERQRRRSHEQTIDELQEQLDEKNLDTGIQKYLRRFATYKKPFSKKQQTNKRSGKAEPSHVTIGSKHSTGSSHHTPKVMVRESEKLWGQGDAPLFLEEAAHLLSLLSAVALSTLRNDLDEADSPLITFVPGQPFPHVDPDAYNADVRKEWDQTTHRSVTILKYFFGFSRSAYSRTLYNAARPFRVIGGVSDAEIEMLQAARGPLAKVALVSMWLQEFFTREHLHGSMGNVGPPIISRLYQFTSDGLLGYNQARKIAYIPFPFPHAQITSLFVLVVIAFMPVLMLTFVSNEILGFFINLLTVMSFTGLHEVSRYAKSTR